MKLTASNISVALSVSALGFAVPSQGAVVAQVVDWFTLVPGGEAGSFSLAADDGSASAHGALAVEPGKGLVFPGFPSARVLDSGFWVANTGFQDSVAGDMRVPGFDIRVVPQSGQSVYTITLDVPVGREMILAVGGLYRGASGATQSVVASAFTDSGSSLVSLIQSLAWNGGDTYDQELEWDTLSSTITTTVGSEGDSTVAFLKIAPLAGANSKIRLSIPSGYASGAGDSITIGLGAPVPEPGVFALLAIGATLFITGRRRQ